MVFERERKTPDEDYGLDANNVNKTPNIEDESNQSESSSVLDQFDDDESENKELIQKNGNRGPPVTDNTIMKNLNQYTDEEVSVTDSLSRSGERKKLMEITNLVSSQESMVYENSDSGLISSDKESEEGNKSMSSKKISMTFRQFRKGSSRSLSKKAGVVYNDDNYLNSDPYMGLNNDDDDSDSDTKVRPNSLAEEKKKKILGSLILASILIIIALLVGLFFLKIENKELSIRLQQVEDQLKNGTFSVVPSKAPSLPHEHTIQPTTNVSNISVIENTDSNETKSIRLENMGNLTLWPSFSPSASNTTKSVTLDNSTSMQPSSAPTLLHRNTSYPSSVPSFLNSTTIPILDNATSLSPSLAPSQLNLTRLANIDDLRNSQSTPAPTLNNTLFINSTDNSHILTNESNTTN